MFERGTVALDMGNFECGNTVNAFPDFGFGLDARGSGPLDGSPSIVDQKLVGADLDQQTGQVAVEERTSGVAA